ncbi:MAG: type I-A CRISPR-associated protein Cas5 [Anaerolineae bacterium]
MWLIAEYKPVTLFSFRSGLATSSGAKTVFLPTPFAIRTALLDAAIRTRGLREGPRAFAWIKALSIAARPPERVVVTNLFTKILKPTRKEEAEEAMDRPIAFREYVYLQGTLGLAFEVAEEHSAQLQDLLAQVNYFGKRGSFFQLLGKPEKVNTLPKGFVAMDGAYLQDAQVKGLVAPFAPGIIQPMDDWGEELTFAKVNVYTDEKIVLGRDRVRKSIVLPYRLIRSSKGFALYERLDA